MFGVSHSFGSQTQHTAFLQIYSILFRNKSFMSPIQIPDRESKDKKPYWTMSFCARFRLDTEFSVNICTISVPSTAAAEVEPDWTSLGIPLALT